MSHVTEIIESFLKEKNNFDSAAFVACFADDAVVHDEGQELLGPAAIKRWIEASNAKYQDTIAAERIVEADNETILTALVTGIFEGSPVFLNFHFVIRKGKISRLRIEPTNK
ncbi:nuclear transport factor 2 family protein [Propionispora hippei]|uniref:SnoaL-like domain-containing protein n=1 Tax=Propionispora hippei DSM 15287 TaxID=1123003 RepID=A0A1M6L850_9FIRM|nr:nuclear transport factor 2 family protein [Propionispora hippei]SHJ67372.1 SnoaL-like domain-containing protein [Propionispora hippei DSM 15287]